MTAASEVACLRSPGPGSGRGRRLLRAKFLCRCCVTRAGARSRLEARAFGRLLGLPHRADETQTPSQDRSDQALLLAVVSDRTSRRIDPAGQRGFGDDTPVPDRSQQGVLADDPVAILDQMQQKIEYLRLDRNQ